MIFKNLLLLSVFPAQRMISAEIPPIPMYVQNKISFLYSSIFISPNVIGIEIKRHIIHLLDLLFLFFDLPDIFLIGYFFFFHGSERGYGCQPPRIASGCSHANLAHFIDFLKPMKLRCSIIFLL